MEYEESGGYFLLGVDPQIMLEFPKDKNELRMCASAFLERIVQTSSLEDYVDEFQIIRAQLEGAASHMCENLDEGFVLKFFIAGLTEDRRAYVKWLRPRTVYDARIYAKYYRGRQFSNYYQEATVIRKDEKIDESLLTTMEQGTIEEPHSDLDNYVEVVEEHENMDEHGVDLVLDDSSNNQFSKGNQSTERHANCLTKCPGETVKGLLGSGISHSLLKLINPCAQLKSVLASGFDCTYVLEMGIELKQFGDNFMDGRYDVVDEMEGDTHVFCVHAEIIEVGLRVLCEFLWDPGIYKPPKVAAVKGVRLRTTDVIEPPNWRLMLGVLSISSIIYLVLNVFWFLESSRWMVSKGKAKQVLQRLRGRNDVGGAMVLLLKGLEVRDGIYIEGSLEYLVGMHRDYFVINQCSFESALSACAGSKSLLGIPIHASLVESPDVLDVCIGSAVIDVYSKCGSVIRIQVVFHGYVSGEGRLYHLEVKLKSHLHLESPDHLRAIITSLANASIYSGCCHQILAIKITQKVFEKVHYLENKQFVELTTHAISSYFTPESNTCSNKHSACTARLAADLCAALYTSIFSGHVKNGFMLFRVLGHDIGVNQAMRSCIHNSVALVARVKRSLIIDWNIHHGNGTQEIFEKNKSIFHTSVHQLGGVNLNFYPGNRVADQVGSMSTEEFGINTPESHEGVRNKGYLCEFQHVMLPIAAKFDVEATTNKGWDSARLSKRELMLAIWWGYQVDVAFSEGYGAQHRFILRMLVMWFTVKWIKMEDSEIIGACSVMTIQKGEVAKEDENETPKITSVKWIHRGIIGSDASTGGTLIAIRGGLPAKAAGFGALTLPLGTIISVIGASDHAAIAIVGGSIVLPALIEVGGVRLTGATMARRTGSANEFQFNAIGKGHKQGWLALEILISVFIFKE